MQPHVGTVQTHLGTVQPHLGTGLASVQPDPGAHTGGVQPQLSPSPPRARASVQATFMGEGMVLTLILIFNPYLIVPGETR